jgi:hypothetical protein
MRTDVSAREEERTILIPTDSVTLAANLSVPERALGSYCLRTGAAVAGTARETGASPEFAGRFSD